MAACCASGGGCYSPMLAAEIPDLVFAGKIGWLTSDLIQQLENAGYLGGKIRFVNSPTEPELAALYQHCLFSVYPSLYEGWGLPVTESLCSANPSSPRIVRPFPRPAARSAPISTRTTSTTPMR